ncbi:LuxR C-terminal-related transcriptional regulator [Kitasatospora sp. NPDC094028]
MNKDPLGQPLTSAEATVLRYLTEGYTIARIAQRQRTRPSTIRSRATRARHKLGAATIDHAVQLHAEQHPTQTTAATTRPN